MTTTRGAAAAGTTPLEQIVDLGAVGRGSFLMLPWCEEAPAVPVRYEGIAAEPVVRTLRLGFDRVDHWRYLPVESAGGAAVVLSSTSPAIARARLVSTPPVLRGSALGVVLPFGGSYGRLRSWSQEGRSWLELACDLLGSGDRRDVLRLTTRDRLTWEFDGAVLDSRDAGPARAEPLPSAPTADGTLVCLLGQEQVAPPEDSLRIWERRLGEPVDGVAPIPLRFRAVPGTWPEITLTGPDGTGCDVTAPAHELRLRCAPEGAGSLTIEVAGFGIAVHGRTVVADGRRLDVPGTGPIGIALRIEGPLAALSVDGRLFPRILSARARHESVGVAAVTGNTAGFRIAPPADANGRIEGHGHTGLSEAVLYGLREPETSTYRAALARLGGPGEPFYESPRFAVYDRCVRDSGGGPDALVPDSTTIVSPVRVVEEFAWRDNGFGDMTRVVDRGEVWRSAVAPGRFPELSTSFTSVDAAFNLALETFQRNSSGEFSLPGEAGMWSAGYFQGPGLGFGVWRRDCAHIALRCGNLLDPAVARRSLAHVVGNGFDNASDGDSLPAVAVWDHYLATGDETLVYETWTGLTRLGSSLDARFDSRRGLVAAPQATSNDCFAEPEAGGFALSTEVYSMRTYEALARMSALPGVRDPRSEHWSRRASAMRRAILEQYWNPDRGYFTSGPAGSESFARGYWETSGAEAAVWGFLGEDAEPLVGSVLDALPSVAMSDFGVVLFPYKDAENHFCGSVWYCWQAGLARAAARTGDAALVHRLIGQQVRSVVRNKSFYEVTDAVTGESWRWPGQLWHAAGFVSLVLFGLLGIDYDADGLSFRPAVAPPFEGIRLRRLRYRSALLDVELRGAGTVCEVTLDGRPVRHIPPGTSGEHTVVLTMS